jgi:hypothetical protein
LQTIVSLDGNRAVLQMQVYLRGHGFPDLSLDGKRSDQLDAALQACFIDHACGRGIAIPGGKNRRYFAILMAKTQISSTSSRMSRATCRDKIPDFAALIRAAMLLLPADGPTAASAV